MGTIDPVALTHKINHHNWYKKRSTEFKYVHIIARMCDFTIGIKRIFVFYSKSFQLLYMKLYYICEWTKFIADADFWEYEEFVMQ